MSLQFLHNRIWNGFALSSKGGSTIVMDVFAPWFFEELKPGDFIEKRIGIATCHPDENYCKKTGREQATAKIKNTKLTVLDVYKSLGGSYINFTTENGEFFRVTKNNGKVRIKYYGKVTNYESGL